MEALLHEIRACQICRGLLPHPPNPVLQAARTSRILIIGQAPGKKVNESGIPWDDLSGESLRKWMGVDQAQFYDPELFALMPMGFCYPGKGASGDLPPRPECAPAWHQKLLDWMPDIRLTLLIGQYAQKYYLKEKSNLNLTETVRNWEKHASENTFPLPHPSPLNFRWMAKNKWFESELLPVLKSRVQLFLV
jgi:uracil-DNA glycosylase